MPKASLALAPKPAVKGRVVELTSPKLTALLDAHLEVSARLDQLKARKDKLQAEILAQVRAKAGDKGTIDTGDFTAQDVHAENSHISRQALAELGVKPTIIEKATKRTPYTYVKVTRKRASLVEQD